MKSIIRWLASISGVEKQIRLDERQAIGYEMRDSAYWFTNISRYGIFYPVFHQLANRLCGKHTLHGHWIRGMVDEWKDRQESGEYDKWHKEGRLL